MLKPPHPFGLRAMRLADIGRVMAIEEVAFPFPWKASAYEYEITGNRLASYQVLTVRLADLPSRVIGYAGFWMLVDEAHISTIAVDPPWRGRGLGELLLLNLLHLAYADAAHVATLEVRQSNLGAQALYKKYQFKVVGERRRYYQGKEDALIMTTSPFNRAYRAMLNNRKIALFARLAGEQVLKDLS